MFSISDTRPVRSMIRMEELLIEKVKLRELLFNTKCRDYRDQNKRCEAWEEIGRELNMSGKSNVF